MAKRKRKSGMKTLLWVGAALVAAYMFVPKFHVMVKEAWDKLKGPPKAPAGGGAA